MEFWLQQASFSVQQLSKWSYNYHPNFQNQPIEHVNSINDWFMLFFHSYHLLFPLLMCYNSWNWCPLKDSPVWELGASDKHFKNLWIDFKLKWTYHCLVQFFSVYVRLSTINFYTNLVQVNCFSRLSQKESFTYDCGFIKQYLVLPVSFNRIKQEYQVYR